MSLSRELSRLGQKIKRRLGVPEGEETRQTPQSPSPRVIRSGGGRWLEKAPWILLTLGFLGALVIGWVQLERLTQRPVNPYIPVVLDAPLQPAAAIRFGSLPSGRYFRIQLDSTQAGVIARDPGPGTRAFQGRSTVARFHTGAPTLQLFPTPCKAEPSDNDVRFVTHDGLLMWMCQPSEDRNQLELRRIGWRLPGSRWSRGVTLGRSARSDLVVGTGVILNQSLSMVRRNTQLEVRLHRSARKLSAKKRLVCIMPAKGKQLPTGSNGCPSKRLFLSLNDEFWLYARLFPHRALRFRWQRSSQEPNHFELMLVPGQGEGVSVRQLQLVRAQELQKQGFLIGNALMYFNDILPGRVRTQDLDERLNPLILRRALVYLSPRELRRALRRRHQSNTNLDTLWQQTPAAELARMLEPLTGDIFLRKRLQTANLALSQNNRLQARSYFQLRWDMENSRGAGELTGLGLGGATLRAPTRNLKKPRGARKARDISLRLSTVLKSAYDSTPFLEVYSDSTRKGTPWHTIFISERHPVELLSAQAATPALRSRQFLSARVSSHPRTLLHVQQNLYVSPHPFAFSGKSRLKSSTGERRFLYTLKGRWWSRKPGLQRSSAWWDLERIARKVATRDQDEALIKRLRELNQHQILKRKHCGAISRRVGSRFRNSTGCWGTKELIKSGAILVLPCSSLVKKSLHTEQCKPGKKRLRLDARGRPMLPATKAMETLAGIVLQQGVETVSGEEKTVVRMQKLKGSLEVLHNGQPVLNGRVLRLNEGDSLTLGSLYLRFRQPGATLAYSRVRGDRVVSVYPWGPVFGHVVAGVAGGPYRGTDDGLRSQIPYPKLSKETSKKTNLVRLKTTLNPDVQQAAFSVGLSHFARLDSREFQRRFRRRYINNPHKPHGGAIAIVNRRNGHLLSAISFPVFNPNRPKKDPSKNERKATYLRGQIVDRYGITDSLLAYSPSNLPPSRPDAKRLQGRPSPIPNFLEALAWDKEEELRGIRGSARSGWLIERALGGVQTPGSTAKLVTAIAYARYLRKRGKAGQFPKHRCAGGLMFQLKTTKNKSGWRPSPIHFRCHKKSGHGDLTLKKALGLSCNVYFAKLALEMAGVPQSQLRTNSIHWHRSRYGVKGKYQFLRIERNQISKAMRSNPSRRILFDTANKLGFAMRYTYRVKRKPKAYASYTDVFWQPGQAPWQRNWKRKDGMTPKQQRWAHSRWLSERWEKKFSFGFFGKGRFFGLASAYPAWQQWARGQKDPRYGKPTSVVRTFGSTAASLRGMAYVGFGQNLSISPFRMALVTGTIANGGWMPAPRFWLPHEQGKGGAPTPRPRNRRIFNAADAKKIQEAMAEVTRAGTAFKPFSSLNRKCLAQFGLKVVGKTGTAETRSAKSRHQLLQKVKSQKIYFRGGSYKKWIAETGCYRRNAWKFDYPEENVADSLFTGTIIPTKTPGTRSLPVGKGWRLQDLAFTMLVKNGYHPQGAACARNGRVLDRSEAKFLAHDVIVSLLHGLGVCKEYRAPSLPAKLLKISKRIRRRIRKRRRTRRTRRKRRVRVRRTRKRRKVRRKAGTRRVVRRRTVVKPRKRSVTRRPVRRRPALRIKKIQ